MHFQHRDYRAYYHLEEHLFDTIHRRFRNAGQLSAFDLFCVVIWKANRSKSKIAARLLRTAGTQDLDIAAKQLTGEICKATTPRQRLEVLLTRWGLRLPMATAILTVCYPEEFTVYDVRVCDALGDFNKLGSIASFPKIWNEYGRFKAAVEAAASSEMSLRDKDRWLWGQSFALQLESDVARGFRVASEVSSEVDEPANPMQRRNGV